MPRASLTMEEGTIQKWRVKEGDYVKKGQVIFEIETDKTSMEIEAEYDGFIKKILSIEGEIVPVTAKIAYLADTKEELEASFETPMVKGSLSAEQEAKSKPELITGSLSGFDIENKHRVIISPVAKNIALQNNLDYTKITGTGPNGKITKDDIENELNLRKDVKKSEAVEPAIKEEKTFKAAITSEEASSFRKTIAGKMSASKAEIPHYYVTMKIDATEMVKFKDKVGRFMKDNNKSPVSFSAIFIKIVATAICQYPLYQSYYHDGRIYKYPSIHIGLAVDINGTLMVPVIKDANNKKLTAISQETTSLIDKCRENKITSDDMSEGCFIISNLGMYDVDNFIAIISKGQSGILALGKIKEEPVVIDGAIEIRKMMTATLSSDHRLIDGGIAAKFMKMIKECIESVYLF